jgi:putative ABC transport system substrate-binding protein
MIDRRVFIVGGVAAFAAPVAAEAQQAGKVFRIGRLEAWSEPEDQPFAMAFEEGLGELGYVRGRNVVIEWKYAERKPERLSDLAEELVRLKPDVIVTSLNNVTAAAQRATATVPIVTVLATNPVSAGFASSLARPGGNITGLTFDVTAETSGKRLALLKETLPSVTRFAVIGRPRADTSQFAAGWLANLTATEDAARAMAVGLQFFEVRAPDDFETVFAAISRERLGGVLVFGEVVGLTTYGHVVSLATRYRVPSMSTVRSFPDAGGLMSYGPSLVDSYRRAAIHVDKILRGAKPGDLAIEQPTKFELVINLKTAKALGLTIPPSLLLRADQVIE